VNTVTKGRGFHNHGVAYVPVTCNLVTVQTNILTFG
jgi:hypothetical protein